MTKEELINKCYQEFGEFQKPDKLTEHQDSLVCQDHEILLKDVQRRDLSIDIIGPSTWSPISYLNSEALAYYMPRLVELALLNVDDVDGEPFLNRFINYFFLGPRNDDRFRLFSQSHQKLIQDVFVFIKNNYNEMLKLEGWKEEVDLAITNWEFRGQDT